MVTQTELVVLEPRQSRLADSVQPLDDTSEPPSDGRREHELAPVDGGLPAWRLLCAAFVFEALLWGVSS